jgi:predicted lipoprotein with Yx(FWY)xxD motif
MAVFTAPFKFRPLSGGLLAIAVAAGLAACGSSSGASTASASGGASHASAGGNGAATAPTTKGSAVAVNVSHDALGTYLVGASGDAVYLWDGDQKDRSNCSGDCATDWPPLTTSTASPVGGAGVKAGDLGTVNRSGGVMQVTYEGHPLYYFAGDGQPGAIDGQGSDGFGAQWWLVTPSGTAITRTAASSAQASSVAAGSSATTKSSDASGGGW